MIHAVFFDIGGTVHTQDATPESDRDYIRRLWCFLHMNHIYTAETPEQCRRQSIQVLYRTGTDRAAAGYDLAEVLPEGL